MEKGTIKILGVDPGYDRLGIAVVEKSARAKEAVLYSDCFQTSPKDSIYERFDAIGSEVARIIQEYKPEDLAIETLFITKNQKTAMRVSESRGIIIYEALKSGLNIFEYGPMEIKMAITGNGKSDKTMVQKMVGLMVKLRDKSISTKIIDDEYDAIAVALTHCAIKK